MRRLSPTTLIASERAKRFLWIGNGSERRFDCHQGTLHRLPLIVLTARKAVGDAAPGARSLHARQNRGKGRRVDRKLSKTVKKRF
jgi:hypothetical protein